jgi:hypothetical protein
MSRIDFARTYTVEHNVKVYEFGQVHRDSLQRLTNQWILVMQQGIAGGHCPLGDIEDVREEGDDEEDDDDEEEEEEEEDDDYDGHGNHDDNEDADGGDSKP